MPKEPPTLPVSTLSLSAAIAHRLGGLTAGQEHALRARTERVASARRIVVAKRRARFHRVHDDAAVGDREPRDMGGGGEGGGDLFRDRPSGSPPRRCRGISVKLRRVVAAASARWSPRGSESMSTSTASAASRAWIRRLGNDDCDGFADMQDPVDGRARHDDQRIGGAVAVLTVRRLAAAEAGRRPGPAPVKMREHAGHGERALSCRSSGSVHARAAAHQDRMGLAGQVEIVGVAARARGRAAVLFAARRFPRLELERRCASSG